MLFIRYKLKFEVVIAQVDKSIIIIIICKHKRLNIDEFQAETDVHMVENLIDVLERILNIFLFRLISIIFVFHILVISETEQF